MLGIPIYITTCVIIYWIRNFITSKIIIIKYLPIDECHISWYTNWDLKIKIPNLIDL